MRKRSAILAALAVASGPFVADAAMAARVPFQRGASTICPTQQTCSLSFAVPPDGRLELINVSCDIGTSGSVSTSGLANAQLIVKGTGQPVDPTSHLPIELRGTPPGELNFTANVQTRLFARTPQKLDVVVSSFGGVMKFLKCTITADHLTPQ